ncbi:site-specific recombinase XerD [Mariniflexile fucanivorans]|uniref:Site-specific recombinase XerD n=1 Tax=Mariniflexile fucanivorans TaxID=264023 RepID=A0A4R1REL2_9FLAO|nr:site-specific integrase [Mariniflexile fucanivorans]TCL64060.1 site-specific recombinase XerD [Mariniflexile fucanivorans]
MTFLKTFNVHFWLKRTVFRKEGTFPIYARITIDGKRADLSTQQTTFENSWCTKSRHIKPKFSGAKEINNVLENIHSKIVLCYRQLSDSGVVVSAQAVKLRYLGKDKPVATIHDLINYHRKNDLIYLSQGTAKNYPSTEKYLHRFILNEFKSSDYYLKNINYSFVASFESYLRQCEPLRKSQPLRNNGIMKHMERFQKLTTLALKHGWVKKNPFSLYQLKFEEFDSAFLDQTEIDRVKLLNSSNVSLEDAKNIFIFSCYTGLCYIEVKNLIAKSIVTGIDGEQWIMVKRQKPKTPLKVPLLDEAKRILEIYRDYPSEQNGHQLLPVLSRQKVNKHLKKIAELYGIDKKLTFHVAHHTFATTITLLNNVPLVTVSNLLSHKKISTTQKYARVIETKISRDMLKLAQALREIESKREDVGSDITNHLRIL